VRLSSTKLQTVSLRDRIVWMAVGGLWILTGFHVGGHGAIVMIGVFIASLMGGITGFAFSAICGAMLFHLGDDPVHVVQIMITCSIANQAAMTWAVRSDIDWRGLGVFLAGGLFGVMIGIWVLLHCNNAVYTQGLGIFLLCYGAYMLIRKPFFIRQQRTTFDFGAGFIGGITGGAGALPGIPVTIWCSMKGWDKARQRALFQPFILIMQIVAFLAIAVARRSSAMGIDYDFGDLLFIPASLLGTSLGLVLYKRLSDGQFARVINILLMISGLGLVA
jgi:uncharacterized membrane protein YfcA